MVKKHMKVDRAHIVVVLLEIQKMDIVLIIILIPYNTAPKDKRSGEIRIGNILGNTKRNIKQKIDTNTLIGNGIKPPIIDGVKYTVRKNKRQQMNNLHKLLELLQEAYELELPPDTDLMEQLIEDLEYILDK